MEEEGSVLTVAGSRLAAEIKTEKMPEQIGGGKEKQMMEVSGSDATKITEKGSSSWVVEIMEEARWNQHTIYRVPEFIKDMTNSEAYRPRFVSIGPLHHGEPQLLPMEKHKRRAMLHMVKSSRKPIQEFEATIDEVADELHAAYNDLDDYFKRCGANKSRFVEMMVMDGCFLLELARTAERLKENNKVRDDCATNDPIFSVGSYRKLWAILRRDMIIMENQIPLVVLQRLLAVYQSGNPESREINKMVLRLLDVPCFGEGMDKLGLHFLDIFHKSYCRTTPPRCQPPLVEQAESGIQFKKCDTNSNHDSGDTKTSRTYGSRTACAVELAESGIRFKKCDTKTIHDVDFRKGLLCGVLSMPLFELHDSTEIYLLNLMAFEWLHPDPDANFFVSSYVSFMDKLIVSERDAALLRSEGIFANMIGRSDKKVVEMFNSLTKLARPPKKGSKLGAVIGKVNDYRAKPLNKLRASFLNTYLRNPWVFISMVAAIILLVATLLQTVYTVVPFYTRND